MKKGRRYFIDVSLKDLNYPINIGLKEKAEGEQTIANITIQAKIEKKMEGMFEKGVMEIISNRNEYKGPKQLSSNLINYLNNLKARSALVSFRYPFFYERTIKESNVKSLIQYMCEYNLRKNTLTEYKQKYKVELPIIAEQYIIPGLQKEILNIPSEVVVEIEGFDTIFTEDIIEIVERNLNKNEYYKMRETIKDILTSQNTGLTLIENIENELYKNNDIEWCSVKLINRRIPYTYSIKVTGDDKTVEYEKRYAGADLFI